jgi:hypothetical protein
MSDDVGVGKGNGNACGGIVGIGILLDFLCECCMYLSF